MYHHFALNYLLLYAYNAYKMYIAEKFHLLLDYNLLELAGQK